MDRDGKQLQFQVLPRKTGGDIDVLAMGIEPIRQLTGLPADEAEVMDRDQIQYLLPADMLGTKPGTLLIEPGDKITAVDGQPVTPNDYPVLYHDLQKSPGTGVLLTISSPDGQTHQGRIFGEFLPPFDQPAAGSNQPDISFAGLVPRARIEEVEPQSPALGKILPGDCIAGIAVDQTIVNDPTPNQLRDVLKNAADNNEKVNLTVVRGDKTVNIDGLLPNMHLGTFISRGGKAWASARHTMNGTRWSARSCPTPPPARPASPTARPSPPSPANRSRASSTSSIGSAKPPPASRSPSATPPSTASHTPRCK